MTIRSEELNKVIARIKDRIKSECREIAQTENPETQKLVDFKTYLIEALRRLNKYEKELESL